MRFAGAALAIGILLAFPGSNAGLEVPECAGNSSVIRYHPSPYPIRPPPFVDFDKDGLGLITGKFELNEGIWEGLDKMVDFIESDCSSSYPLITATLSMEVESLKLYGNYEIDAMVNLLSLSIVGMGNLSIETCDPRLQLMVRAWHDSETDELVGESASFDIGFEMLSLYSENLKLCGVQVPWDLVNEAMGAGWNLFWKANKPELDKLLSFLAQDLLEGCTLAELIADNWKADCINVGHVISTLIRQWQQHPVVETLLQMMGLTCESATTSIQTGPTGSITTHVTSATQGTNSAKMREHDGGWMGGLIALVAVFI